MLLPWPPPPPVSPPPPPPPPPGKEPWTFFTDTQFKTASASIAIDAKGDVANCAITDYRFNAEAGKLVLQRYNVTAPMEEEATPVTKAPDRIAGARG